LAAIAAGSMQGWLNEPFARFVLDITAADADAARPLLPPTARPGAEWILAAQREAWRLGCKSGREVKSWELPPDHPSAAAPRQVLLTRDDLIHLGLIHRG
jgi:hypothetical protein